MHPVLADLIELLKLERIEDNIFRGDSRDIGSAQVFGGQVLGQALTAAQHTVEGRIAHSLHAYFLRRGDMKAPIVYEVDRARDGGSFSTRRVVAIQHGRPIFNLAASFQIDEEGVDHQAEMPDVPGPEGLKDLSDVSEETLARLPGKMRRFLTDKRPFELRPVTPISFPEPRKLPPVKRVWFRTSFITPLSASTKPWTRSTAPSTSRSVSIVTGSVVVAFSVTFTPGTRSVIVFEER